jgi:hypothetical protein
VVVLVDMMLDQQILVPVVAWVVPVLSSLHMTLYNPTK